MAGTPHSLLSDLYSVCATDENLIDDPGDGEVAVVGSKSGGFMSLASGDVVLPDAPSGVTLTLFATATGTTNVRDANSNTVATMLQGDLVTATSVGSGWKAVSSAGATDPLSSIGTFVNATDLRGLGGQSYTSNPSANAGAEIQEFFDDLGGSEVTDHNILAINGDAYHTTQHITIAAGAGAGGALIGTGSPVGALGTSEYSSNLGSSRIVKTGTNTAGEAVITIGALGFNLSGLTIQGHTAATFAEIWSDHGSYCDVGLFVPSTPVDALVGTGKIHGDVLCVDSCGTGVKLGSSALGEHADDFTYKRIIFSNCDVGFHTNSVQVVNTWIGTMHCQGVGTGWKAEKGGNSVCGVLYYGELANEVTPVAAMEIGSASYSANADKHVFLLVTMDGSVDTAKILLANNAATAHIVIQCLHVPIDYSVVEPLVIAGPKVVIIESGGDLYEGMFRLIENIDGKPTLILRSGVRLRTGEDRTLLVTQGVSDGTGYLLQEGTITAYNGGSGPAERLMQTWTNNVAS